MLVFSKLHLLIKSLKRKNKNRKIIKKKLKMMDMTFKENFKKYKNDIDKDELYWHIMYYS